MKHNMKLISILLLISTSIQAQIVGGYNGICLIDTTPTAIPSLNNKDWERWNNRDICDVAYCVTDGTFYYRGVIRDTIISPRNKRSLYGSTTWVKREWCEFELPEKEILNYYMKEVKVEKCPRCNGSEFIYNNKTNTVRRCICNNNIK